MLVAATILRVRTGPTQSDGPVAICLGEVAERDDVGTGHTRIHAGLRLVRTRQNAQRTPQEWQRGDIALVRGIVGPRFHELRAQRDVRTCDENSEQ